MRSLSTSFVLINQRGRHWQRPSLCTRFAGVRASPTRPQTWRRSLPPRDGGSASSTPRSNRPESASSRAYCELRGRSYHRNAVVAKGIGRFDRRSCQRSTCQGSPRPKRLNLEAHNPSVPSRCSAAIHEVHNALSCSDRRHLTGIQPPAAIENRPSLRTFRAVSKPVATRRMRAVKARERSPPSARPSRSCSSPGPGDRLETTAFHSTVARRAGCRSSQMWQSTGSRLQEAKKRSAGGLSMRSPARLMVTTRPAGGTCVW